MHLEEAEHEGQERKSWAVWWGPVCAARWTGGGWSQALRVRQTILVPLERAAS